MRTSLLLCLCLALVASVNAQSADTLVLSSSEFINTQILDDQASGTPHTVYMVEAGQFYSFDGRLDVNFPMELIGPDNGWIYNDATPPVIVNSPAEDGAARDFFELQEGGSIVLKNVMLSGLNNQDNTTGLFVANTGGSMMVAHNVAFANWTNFALRNQAKNIDISITDCVFH